jgi:Zn finger protein HypA/HybF involved in hydrogenase expression
VLIEYPRPHVEDQLVSQVPYRETASPIAPRVVRCACEVCGAHTNALWTFRVGGSCPTCGSFRLAPIAGAELMDVARMAA